MSEAIQSDDLQQLVHIIQNADTTYDAIQFAKDAMQSAETKAKIDQLERLKPYLIRPQMYDMKRVYDELMAELTNNDKVKP